MKTSLHLREYDDFINSQDVYSLIGVFNNLCLGCIVTNDCRSEFMFIEYTEYKFQLYFKM